MDKSAPSVNNVAMYCNDAARKTSDTVRHLCASLPQRKKMKATFKTHRRPGAITLLCRNASLNSTTMKATLRTNNRALALALEAKKSELSRAQNLILRLRGELQAKSCIIARIMTVLEKIGSNMQTSMTDAFMLLEYCHGGELLARPGRGAVTLAPNATARSVFTRNQPTEMSRTAVQNDVCTDSTRNVNLLQSSAEIPVAGNSARASATSFIVPVTSMVCGPSRVPTASLEDDEGDQNNEYESDDFQDSYNNDKCKSTSATDAEPTNHNLSVIAERSGMFQDMAIDSSLDNSAISEQLSQSSRTLRRNTIILRPQTASNSSLSTAESHPELKSALVASTVVVSRGRGSRSKSHAQVNLEHDSTISNRQASVASVTCNSNETDVYAVDDDDNGLNAGMIAASELSSIAAYDTTRLAATSKCGAAAVMLSASVDVMQTVKDSASSSATNAKKLSDADVTIGCADVDSGREMSAIDSSENRVGVNSGSSSEVSLEPNVVILKNMPLRPPTAAECSSNGIDAQVSVVVVSGLDSESLSTNNCPESQNVTNAKTKNIAKTTAKKAMDKKRRSYARKSAGSSVSANDLAIDTVCVTKGVNSCSIKNGNSDVGTVLWKNRIDNDLTLDNLDHIMVEEAEKKSSKVTKVKSTAAVKTKSAKNVVTKRDCRYTYSTDPGMGNLACGNDIQVKELEEDDDESVPRAFLEVEKNISGGYFRSKDKLTRTPIKITRTLSEELGGKLPHSSAGAMVASGMIRKGDLPKFVPLEIADILADDQCTVKQSDKVVGMVALVGTEINAAVASRPEQISSTNVRMSIGRGWNGNDVAGNVSDSVIGDSVMCNDLDEPENVVKDVIGVQDTAVINTKFFGDEDTVIGDVEIKRRPLKKDGISKCNVDDVVNKNNWLADKDAENGKKENKKLATAEWEDVSDRNVQTGAEDNDNVGTKINRPATRLGREDVSKKNTRLNNEAVPETNRQSTRGSTVNKKQCTSKDTEYIAQKSQLSTKGSMDISQESASKATQYFEKDGQKSSKWNGENLVQPNLKSTRVEREKNHRRNDHKSSRSVEDTKAATCLEGSPVHNAGKTTRRRSSSVEPKSGANEFEKEPTNSTRGIQIMHKGNAHTRSQSIDRWGNGTVDKTVYVADLTVSDATFGEEEDNTTIIVCEADADHTDIGLTYGHGSVSDDSYTTVSSAEICRRRSHRPKATKLLDSNFVSSPSSLAARGNEIKAVLANAKHVESGTSAGPALTATTVKDRLSGASSSKSVVSRTSCARAIPKATITKPPVVEACGVPALSDVNSAHPLLGTGSQRIFVGTSSIPIVPAASTQSIFPGADAEHALPLVGDITNCCVEDMEMTDVLSSTILSQLQQTIIFAAVTDTTKSSANMTISSGCSDKDKIVKPAGQTRSNAREMRDGDAATKQRLANDYVATGGIETVRHVEAEMSKQVAVTANEQEYGSDKIGFGRSRNDLLHNEDSNKGISGRIRRNVGKDSVLVRDQSGEVDNNYAAAVTQTTRIQQIASILQSAPKIRAVDNEQAVNKDQATSKDQFRTKDQIINNDQALNKAVKKGQVINKEQAHTNRATADVSFPPADGNQNTDKNLKTKRTKTDIDKDQKIQETIAFVRQSHTPDVPHVVERPTSIRAGEVESNIRDADERGMAREDDLNQPIHGYPCSKPLTKYQSSSEDVNCRPVKSQSDSNLARSKADVCFAARAKMDRAGTKVTNGNVAANSAASAKHPTADDKTSVFDTASGEDSSSISSAVTIRSRRRVRPPARFSDDEPDSNSFSEERNKNSKTSKKVKMNDVGVNNPQRLKALQLISRSDVPKLPQDQDLNNSSHLFPSLSIVRSEETSLIKSVAVVAETPASTPSAINRIKAFTMADSVATAAAIATSATREISSSAASDSLVSLNTMEVSINRLRRASVGLVRLTDSDRFDHIAMTHWDQHDTFQPQNKAAEATAFAPDSDVHVTNRVSGKAAGATRKRTAKCLEGVNVVNDIPNGSPKPKQPSAQHQVIGQSVPLTVTAYLDALCDELSDPFEDGDQNVSFRNQYAVTKHRPGRPLAKKAPEVIRGEVGKTVKASDQHSVAHQYKKRCSGSSSDISDILLSSPLRVRKSGKLIKSAKKTKNRKESPMIGSDLDSTPSANPKLPTDLAGLDKIKRKYKRKASSSESDSIVGDKDRLSATEQVMISPHSIGKRRHPKKATSTDNALEKIPLEQKRGVPVVDDIPINSVESQPNLRESQTMVAMADAVCRKDNQAETVNAVVLKKYGKGKASLAKSSTRPMESTTAANFLGDGPAADSNANALFDDKKSRVVHHHAEEETMVNVNKRTKDNKGRGGKNNNADLDWAPKKSHQKMQRKTSEPLRESSLEGSKKKDRVRASAAVGGVVCLDEGGVGERLIGQVGEVRSRRAASAAISYKEPPLGGKLRRGDPFTSTIYGYSSMAGLSSTATTATTSTVAPLVSGSLSHDNLGGRDTKLVPRKHATLTAIADKSIDDTSSQGD